LRFTENQLDEWWHICYHLWDERRCRDVLTGEAEAEIQRKPIPNDITFDEVERLANAYGCKVLAGGKHSKKIVDVPSGTVIPIPMHGKHVQEAYIKELKDLFAEIENRRKEDE
jgi:hypothetical protein